LALILTTTPSKSCKTTTTSQSNSTAIQQQHSYLQHQHNNTIALQPWESVDFFSREGQNFPGGGGQKHTICLKTVKEHTIFIQKSQKTFYFGRPRGGGQLPTLALPCGRP